MASAARVAASGAGAAHSSVEHTSSEIGARDAHLGQQAHEAGAVELTLAGRDAVGEAVLLVVVELRLPRPVVHLHGEDAVGGQRGDQRLVVGTAPVVPDVGAVPTVGTAGRLDDRLGVGGRGDVRVRQPLDADEQAVLGGPVAELAERLRRLS